MQACFYFFYFVYAYRWEGKSEEVFTCQSHTKGDYHLKKLLAFLLCVLLILPHAGMAVENAEQNQSDDWNLVWADEFDGTQIDKSKWSYDIGNWIVDGDGNGIAPGWGNNELEYYTDSAENSFIRDGKLVIKAVKEKTEDEFGSYEYTSAKLKTKGLFSKKYGKFEARIKLPEGQGYWPAFWLLPENDVYGGWAASGEIDIMEAAGAKTDEIGGTIHYGDVYPNNVYKGASYHFPEGESITDFHTYSIEWEPGEIRWYVDGNLYQTLDNWYSKNKNNAANYSFPAPFDQEFYMILNLAVGGWYGGNPDQSTSFPGEMEIDYVRVYELEGRDYQTPVEPNVEKVELPPHAKQPLEDGNFIYDRQYEKGFTKVIEEDQALDSTYWNFVQLPSFGGKGQISATQLNEQTFAKVDIDNPGNALWSLQKIQQIPAATGATYKVSFDAKSTSTRNMMVKVSGGADRGWTKYSNEEAIELTSTLKTYSFTFDMTHETDLAARLEFNMGANGTSPIWIGNVKVEDITGQQDHDVLKEPLPDGNHIYNGTFDQGKIDRMTYWDFLSEGNAEALGSVNEEIRAFKATIIDGGVTSSDIKLKQSGIQFAKGNTYKLTFKAKSNQSRSLEVDIRGKDGLQSYHLDSVNLTTEMEEKTVEFLIPESYEDSEGQLIFYLGGNQGDIFIDDVTLLNTDRKLVAPEVLNGEFTENLDGWTPYVHFDANAQISHENGEAKASITNQGNEEWSVILEQKGLKFREGEEYVISFDIRSTLNRKIIFSLENNEYKRYLSETVDVTEEMENVQYKLVMPENDTLNLKFQMGKYGGVPHDLYIDHVKIALAGEETPEDPPTSEEEMTPELDNGMFNEGLKHWNQWWGDQWSGLAQGNVTIDDGTLVVDLLKTGATSYSPQIFQKGIQFKQGETYKVSFEGKVDEARKLNVNIGKELAEDPWFVPFAPSKTFDLTNEMTTYSYTFEMTEQSFDDGKLVFELGNIEGGNAATKIYLDNISIEPVIASEEDVPSKDDESTEEEIKDKEQDDDAMNNEGDNSDSSDEFSSSDNENHPATSEEKESLSPTSDDSKDGSDEVPAYDKVEGDGENQLPQTATRMFERLLVGVLICGIGGFLLVKKRRMN